MKTHVLFLFLSLLVSSAFAQINTNIIRQESIGGSGNDFLSKVIKTTDGYLLAGSSDSDISGDKTDACRGGTDIWLIKTNDDFSIQWQKTIGGSGDETLIDMEMTPDRGCMIAGYTNSPISGEKTVANYGYIDYWLIRTDKNGNIVWQKTFGGALGSTSYLIGLCKKSESEYVMYGYSTSGTGGVKTEYCRGYCDIWLVSVDSSGNILWDKTIGGDNFDIVKYCSYDSINNQIQISGSTFSSISGEITSAPFGVYADAMYFVVNADNGEVVDEFRYGGSRAESSFFHHSFSDKTLFVTYSNSDSSGLKTENNKSTDSLDCDFWLCMYSNHAIVSDKTIGGLKQDYPISQFIYASENQMIIVGYSDSGIGADKTESSRGVTDFWIVAVDTNLNILWQKTIGSNSYDFTSSMIQLGANHYVIAGGSRSGIHGEKTEASNGLSDMWILEISNTMSLEDFSKNRLSIYPNPATDFVNIEIPDNNKNGLVYVFDISGSIVQSKTISNGENRIEVSNLAAGLYFISFYDETGKSWTGEMVKQ